MRIHSTQLKENPLREKEVYHPRSVRLDLEHPTQALITIEFTIILHAAVKPTSSDRADRILPSNGHLLGLNGFGSLLTLQLSIN